MKSVVSTTKKSFAIYNLQNFQKSPLNFWVLAGIHQVVELCCKMFKTVLPWGENFCGVFLRIDFYLALFFLAFSVKQPRVIVVFNTCSSESQEVFVLFPHTQLFSLQDKFFDGVHWLFKDAHTCLGLTWNLFYRTEFKFLAFFLQFWLPFRLWWKLHTLFELHQRRSIQYEREFHLIIIRIIWEY